MRTIHYTIFIDFFQDTNVYTGRKSVKIQDECTNTTIEIMKYIYNKYHSKMCPDDYHTCSVIFIEENAMEKFVNICDLTPDEYDAFFDKQQIDLKYEPKFIENDDDIEININNDTIYCCFDFQDYLDDAFTFVQTYTFADVRNNLDFVNQVNNKLEEVKQILYEKDDRNTSYFSTIKCWYVLKGKGSWKLFNI